MARQSDILQQAVLFGSVLQEFDETEIHANVIKQFTNSANILFVKWSVNVWNFEAKVKEFLSDRQQVIDTNLDDYERAIKNKDPDAMSGALNNIAEEFGGELQFKTKKEFEDFMKDKNALFKL